MSPASFDPSPAVDDPPAGRLLLKPRRLREERERLAAEAARQQSQLLTLQSMFKTGVSGPGEQPTGVTLVDGYNMLHMASGRAGCTLLCWCLRSCMISTLRCIGCVLWRA